MLLQEARRHLHHGELEKAYTMAEKIVERSQAGPKQEEQEEAEALLLCGQALQRLGDERRALEMKRASLALLREHKGAVSDQRRMAEVLAAVAASLVDLGDKNA
ncbi:unnamed protein product [Durusdinium trenchii]|uniref:Uncharacterized protein n=1 Tax=Durusdinium trenchii TaxID=1381693 RepID=A0ABP0RPV6_9DINO